MEITLFEPEIAGNVGSTLRMAACLGLKVNLIEPFGFVFGSAQMRRAGMDYLADTNYQKFASFSDYMAKTKGRKVLLQGKAQASITDFVFTADDHFIVGRESSGVPAEVAAKCAVDLAIPMQPGKRSFNATVAIALVVGAFLRSKA